MLSLPAAAAAARRTIRTRRVASLLTVRRRVTAYSGVPTTLTVTGGTPRIGVLANSASCRSRRRDRLVATGCRRVARHHVKITIQDAADRPCHVSVKAQRRRAHRRAIRRSHTPGSRRRHGHGRRPPYRAFVATPRSCRWRRPCPERRSCCLRPTSAPTRRSTSRSRMPPGSAPPPTVTVRAGAAPQFAHDHAERRLTAVGNGLCSGQTGPRRSTVLGPGGRRHRRAAGALRRRPGRLRHHRRSNPGAAARRRR